MENYFVIRWKMRIFAPSEKDNSFSINFITLLVSQGIPSPDWLVFYIS